MKSLEAMQGQLQFIEQLEKYLDRDINFIRGFVAGYKEELNKDIDATLTNMEDLENA